MPERAPKRDEEHIPPLPQRAAPEDRVLPIREDHRVPPAPDVRVQLDRMEGEGGGSAPLQDAPESPDLRDVPAAKRTTEGAPSGDSHAGD